MMPQSSRETSPLVAPYSPESVTHCRAGASVRTSPPALLGKSKGPTLGQFLARSSQTRSRVHLLPQTRSYPPFYQENFNCVTCITFAILPFFSLEIKSSPLLPPTSSRTSGYMENFWCTSYDEDEKVDAPTDHHVSTIVRDSFYENSMMVKKERERVVH